MAIENPALEPKVKSAVDLIMAMIEAEILQERMEKVLENDEFTSVMSRLDGVEVVFTEEGENTVNDNGTKTSFKTQVAAALAFVHKTHPQFK